jgi:polyphosphate kinase 2 (PPK2 family)
MEVSELILKLQTLNQDATIKVIVPFEGRPYGGTDKELSEITETVDQDTNKVVYTTQLSEYEPY